MAVRSALRLNPVLELFDVLAEQQVPTEQGVRLRNESIVEENERISVAMTHFFVAGFGQFRAENVANTRHISNALVADGLSHELAELLRRRTHCYS